jgi:phage-related minor tail protein
VRIDTLGETDEVVVRGNGTETEALHDANHGGTMMSDPQEGIETYLTTEETVGVVDEGIEAIAMVALEAIQIGNDKKAQPLHQRKRNLHQI